MGRKLGKPNDDAHDTPEQIRACLSCPYPTCRPGCVPLVKPGKEPRNVRARLDENNYGASLLERGMSDKEIAALVGSTAGVVCKWRHSRGLASAQKRRKEKRLCRVS